MNDIEQTLKERGARYGQFANNAPLAQHLKNCLRETLRHRQYQPAGVINEGLDQICSKLARIVCGDPTYKDNWHDIIGYCTLVLRELEDEK